MSKIAVIGAGVAGLATSFLLSKRHDIVLFEASSSLGGHAHAESLVDSQGRQMNVDTAFLIFNDKTYTQFNRFLEALGVSDKAGPVAMSSCFSDIDRDFHYALGNGLAPFLAEPSIFFRPDLARILVDLYRFRKHASTDLQNGRDLSGVTADEYFAPYSAVFRENFLYPLTAAIWSLPLAKMKQYPIATLLSYFDNHQLLSGRGDRRWRTFSGSSSVYVDAFARSFKGEIRLETPIKKIRRTADSVEVLSAKGAEKFAHVVLATHADVSFKLLANPTSEEARLLGAWNYQDNLVTLHSDPSFLHANPKLWCSWNMRRENNEYRISYFLNRLQSLKTLDPVILTLGECSPRKDLVKKTFSYRHPVFDACSVATQPWLSSLNNVDRISFCGSYFGHGFHEDAVQSATQVADALGVSWNTPTI